MLAGLTGTWLPTVPASLHEKKKDSNEGAADYTISGIGVRACGVFELVTRLSPDPNVRLT